MSLILPDPLEPPNWGGKLNAALNVLKAEVEAATAATDAQVEALVTDPATATGAALLSTYARIEDAGALFREVVVDDYLTGQVDSIWGISATGTPYHDDTGAAVGEVATFGFDTTGQPTLTKVIR